MALNPVATGILMGSISGAAMGFMVGGPAGAVIGGTAGAITGGAGASEAQKKELAQKAAGKQAAALGVANQNALMESEYKKKMQTRGLGDMASGAGATPSGIGASQTGAVLTTTAGTQNNILG